MSLLDDITAKTGYSGHPLRVQQIIDTLEEEDPKAAAELLVALKDPIRYGARPIAAALTSRGHRVGSEAVGKWRDRNGVT